MQANPSMENVTFVATKPCFFMSAIETHTSVDLPFIFAVSKAERLGRPLIVPDTLIATRAFPFKTKAQIELLDADAIRLIGALILAPFRELSTRWRYATPFSFVISSAPWMFGAVISKV